MIRFLLSLIHGLQGRGTGLPPVSPRRPMARVRFKKRFFAGMGALAIGATTFASQAESFELRRTIQVDGAGVFFRDLFKGGETNSTAAVQLADAPKVGQAITWDGNQVRKLVAEKAGLELSTNLAGADRVTITRRTRLFTERELKDLLQAALQQDHVKDRGELELRFARPWNAIMIPDEPFTVRILDVPATGLSQSFVCRFEIVCSESRILEAQVLLQARIWREILVSSGPLKRGESLRSAEVKSERRDVLAVRDHVPSRVLQEGDFEVTENLVAGTPLTSRSIRTRPVIFKGALVEALVRDGGLLISLKVEALEDGVVGQTLRVRNPKTKRELLGKVHNEQTVILNL